MDLELSANAMRALDFQDEEIVVSLKVVNDIITQLRTELQDRCATIDAIDEGKAIDYFVTAQRLTNRELMDCREQLRMAEQERDALVRLLLRYEWKGQDGHCPDCGWNQNTGHGTGCELMKATRKEIED